MPRRRRNPLNETLKTCPCCKRRCTQPNIGRHHEACVRKFAAWKEKARQFIDEELSLGDIWDKDDPYEVAKIAAEAFRNGVKPESFILDAFEDDFGRRDLADLEFDESLEYAFEEG